MFQSPPVASSSGATVYTRPPYSPGTYAYGSSGSYTPASETYRGSYSYGPSYPGQGGLQLGGSPPSYAASPHSDVYVNGVWYKRSDLVNLYGYGSGSFYTASVPGYGYTGIPYGSVPPQYGGQLLSPGYPSLYPSPYSDVYVNGMWYKPSDLPNLFGYGSSYLYSASVPAYGYRRLPYRPILPRYGGYGLGTGLPSYSASPYSDVYINGMWYKPSDLPNLYNVRGSYGYGAIDPGYGYGYGAIDPAYGYPYGAGGPAYGYDRYAYGPDFPGLDAYPLGPAFNDSGPYRPWSPPSRYSPGIRYPDDRSFYGPAGRYPDDGSFYGHTIYGYTPTVMPPAVSAVFANPTVYSWNPLQRLGIFGLTFGLPSAAPPERTMMPLAAPNWIPQFGFETATSGFD